MLHAFSYVSIVNVEKVDVSWTDSFLIEIYL